MDKTKSCLIEFLKSFLRGKTPKADNSTDWKSLYDLAQSHNVTGIISHQILTLDTANQPDSDTLARFRQNLGQTLLNSDKKDFIVQNTDEILCRNCIKHIYLKGSRIKKYYKVPELRTCGDVDIYIDKSDLSTAVSILESSGYKKYEVSGATATLIKNSQYVELHDDADVGFDYFENLFDLSQSENGYTYYMKEEYELAYVICHLIKHLKCYGAGIRMLLDIDVLIYANKNYNEDLLLDLCDKIGCKKAACTLLALSKYWFDTPTSQHIDFALPENEKALQLFEKLMLERGSFGLQESSVGGVYLNKNAVRGKKVTKLTSILAFFNLLFPNAEILYKSFPFCGKHHILLPVAWLCRAYVGIFMRGHHSINTAKEIFQNRDKANIQNDLATLLEI